MGVMGLVGLAGLREQRANKCVDLVYIQDASVQSRVFRLDRMFGSVGCAQARS